MTLVFVAKQLEIVEATTQSICAVLRAGEQPQFTGISFLNKSSEFTAWCYKHSKNYQEAKNYQRV